MTFVVLSRLRPPTDWQKVLPALKVAELYSLPCSIVVACHVHWDELGIHPMPSKLALDHFARNALEEHVFWVYPVEKRISVACTVV